MSVRREVQGMHILDENAVSGPSTPAANEPVGLPFVAFGKPSPKRGSRITRLPDEEDDVEQPAEASLLGIPPELRNTIYKHLLGFATEKNHSKPQGAHYMRPKGTVRFGSTPSILRVCKQMRSEFVQMFLANTDFFAETEASNTYLNAASLENPSEVAELMEHTSYQDLIDGLHCLGPKMIPVIKSITIINHDLGWKDIDISQSDPDTDFGAARDLALYNIWNQFIPGLFATGLRPDQLKWPGLCVGAEDLDDANFKDVGEGKRSIVRFGNGCQNTLFLYEGIVFNILRRHGGCSVQSPIAKIVKQARQFKCLNNLHMVDQLLWRMERLDEMREEELGLA